MLSIETAPFPSTSALLAPYSYKKCSCMGTPTCRQIADAFPGIRFSCDECEHAWKKYGERKIDEDIKQYYKCRKCHIKKYVILNGEQKTDRVVKTIFIHS